MPVDAAGVLEAESPAARFGADTASVPEADRAVHSGEGTEAGPEAHGDNRFVQVVGHRKADDFDFGYKGTGDTVYNKDWDFGHMDAAAEVDKAVHRGADRAAFAPGAGWSAALETHGDSLLVQAVDHRKAAVLLTVLAPGHSLLGMASRFHRRTVHQTVQAERCPEKEGWAGTEVSVPA